MSALKSDRRSGVEFPGLFLAALQGCAVSPFHCRRVGYLVLSSGRSSLYCSRVLYLTWAAKRRRLSAARSSRRGARTPGVVRRLVHYCSDRVAVGCAQSSTLEAPGAGGEIGQRCSDRQRASATWTCEPSGGVEAGPQLRSANASAEQPLILYLHCGSRPGQAYQGSTGESR